MTLRFRLQHLVDEAGVSLYSIAKRTGLSYPTVHGIYHNRTAGITLDVLEKLADALGVEPGEMFERKRGKS